ncbi:MAG TPA: ABC transporter permease [Actinomycetota bacterium]|nr:ABC transporter permease [Actinomycetota bacterium]
MAGVQGGLSAAAAEGWAGGLRVREVAGACLRWGFLGLVLAILYGPVAILVAFAFNDSIIIALPFRGFTLRWFGEAFGNPLVLESLRNSLGVAAGTTPVSLLLGTLAAVGITRFRFRARGAVAGLVAAPLVVPWLLIGVGALLYFNRLHVPLSLRTVGAMHVVSTFPLVAAIVSARLVRFDPALEEAGLDLGATPREVLRHVVLPQIAPALAAAAIFAFSWSFNNFEISFFTAGFELTFPIWVFSTLRHAQNLPVVNAVSTVVSVVQVVAVYGAWRMVRRHPAGRGPEGPEALPEVVVG